MLKKELDIPDNWHWTYQTDVSTDGTIIFMTHNIQTLFLTQFYKQHPSLGVELIIKLKISTLLANMTELLNLAVKNTSGLILKLPSLAAVDCILIKLKNLRTSHKVQSTIYINSIHYFSYLQRTYRATLPILALHTQQCIYENDANFSYNKLCQEYIRCTPNSISLTWYLVAYNATQKNFLTLENS